MKNFDGKAITEGIACGKISIYERNKNKVQKEKRNNWKQEIEKVRTAKKCSLKQLQKLYDKAVLQAGEKDAEIFHAHQMLLEDKGYTYRIETLIRDEGVNAEYAVNTVGEDLYQHFYNMDNLYLKERAQDIKDVSARLVRNLSDQSYTGPELKRQTILFSDYFTPGEIMELDQKKIMAIVLSKGSEYSHMAILARSMAIPVLIDTKINLKNIHNGIETIVDCFDGKVYIAPNNEIKKIINQKISEEEKKREELLKIKEKDCVLNDGKRILLCANINDEGEIEKALENGADGIGLFRSEFIYMKKDCFPSEEEQFLIYKKAAEKLHGKKLVIRTIDIGSDKKIDYFNMDEEENPALGCRGIRVSLADPDIFKVQLRAVFRASIYGNISLLYPMVISIDEIDKIKQIVCDVKKELNEEKIPYKNVREGIMIETPAAVMISRELAKRVDFFSIGTNDLTQYTLALDRQNPAVRQFYDPYHPAVIEMIKIVTDHAHKEGKKVGICGELSGDTHMTKIFLEIGIDELSMSSSKILRIKKNILDNV